MIRRQIRAFAPNVPVDALEALDAGEAVPAWLIDIDRGLILAATASGAAVLGLSGDAAAYPLDAAMPALQRLRALSSADMESGSSPQPLVFWTLVFWTPAGAVRCLCRIVLVPSMEGARLAAVTAHEEAHAGRLAAASAEGGANLAPDGDGAKLKTVAQRIRSRRAAEPDVEPMQPIRRPTHSDAGPEMPDADAAGRAHLAHELRTPLSAIAAAAEVMKDQRLGSIGSTRYLGYARDIHASATHALAVIERMLAEARSGPALEADALAFSEVDTAALLESSLSQLSPLAARAGITLSLDLAPRLPHLVVDATSLRQIVLNLATNALKFTPAGGAVTVSAHYAGDGPLTIAISDTGRGMTPEEATDALGGRRSTPRGGMRDAAGSTGLGLGLPLVNALAAANGAEVVIESAPGRGTSVSVVFRNERVVPV